ncbi:lantibiotic dehydratase [Planomonospora sphaerica]|uniref:Lantibiotic dehydratase n=1 Tax=Planomonospora sphaerica TaxID=161355 RepID=A0A171DKD0_9ACTN|nr:lantibiotic dehydratase [Planomonospora sphaerica]GAT69279.1 lantibiotic dehydratase [Planomonospora sphaerica]
MAPVGEDPVSPDRGRVVLGPVVVRRRCLLPGSVLAGLGGDRVWRAAGAVADAELACSRRGGDLADRISALVPAAAKEERRGLLRARRDAFNSRPVGTGLPADPETAGLAAAYTDALAFRDAAGRELASALAELARTTGTVLETALGDPDLAWSVELSVPGLSTAGPIDPGPAAGRRARRRALTLLRLVQRAASKPTPFARSATTTLLFRGAGEGFPLRGAGESPPRSHVRVRREVLDWTRRWIADGGYRYLRPDRMWLTVNPSATVADGDGDGGLRVTWLVTGENGTERFASARCGPDLVSFLRGVRDPVRLDALLAGGALPGVLTDLIGRGMLEVGPRLPSHGRRTLRAAADAAVPARTAGRDDAPSPGAAGRDDGPSPRAVHDALCGLRDAEHAAAHGGDTGTVRRAAAGIGALARALGLDAGGIERAPVSEDVVGTGPDDGILRADPGLLADLGRVQRIVPLLGAELPFQLATATAFRRRFGPDPVPLLAAYRWFAESGRTESDALLADCSTGELAVVLDLRTRLFAGLRAAAQQPGAEEVPCDPALLDALAADLPDAVLDLPCAAWPLQQAGERVVVNGVSSGYGRFAARFGAALDDRGMDELRHWAATAAAPHDDGVMVDISALLGATVNEHPLVLPAALSYPGRALECAPATRIDLSECVVQAAGGRLLLFSDRFAGRPLFPVPHNSTLPTVAPGLYRWLSRFGPVSGTTLDLWDQVDAMVTAEAPQASESVRHYPRLVLGRLVLGRRTWKVPGAALPAAEPGPAEAAAWHRWCARTGVPRRSFLRTVTIPDPWSVVRGLADKRAVLEARSPSGAAVRKPIYVDLSQPLCWPALAVAPETTLTFTEPLPDPAATGEGRAAEYVLETSRPPRVLAGRAAASEARRTPDA